MANIKIYQTGKVGVKGEVVFPQKLREFMGISTGSEIAFKIAEKKGDEYTITIEVVK